MQDLKEHQETEENWWVIDDSNTSTKQNHLCETVKDKCKAPGSRIKSGGVLSNDYHMKACHFLSFYQTFANLLQTNICLHVLSFAGRWRRTRRERIGTFTCTKHHNHNTTLPFTSHHKVLFLFSDISHIVAAAGKLLLSHEKLINNNINCCLTAFCLWEDVFIYNSDSRQVRTEFTERKPAQRRHI